jgi:hypothetical protein
MVERNWGALELLPKESLMDHRILSSRIKQRVKATLQKASIGQKAVTEMMTDNSRAVSWGIALS